MTWTSTSWSVTWRRSESLIQRDWAAVAAHGPAAGGRASCDWPRPACAGARSASGRRRELAAKTSSDQGHGCIRRMCNGVRRRRYSTEASIQAPGGLRNLIEAVHGEDAPEVPEALQGAEIETLGRQMSEAQQALNQVLDADDAYDQPQMQRVFDDERYPTRLGIPQVTLRLAREREEDGRLLPWAGERPLGWQSSGGADLGRAVLETARHRSGSAGNHVRA